MIYRYLRKKVILFYISRKKTDVIENHENDAHDDTLFVYTFLLDEDAI